MKRIIKIIIQVSFIFIFAMIFKITNVSALTSGPFTYQINSDGTTVKITDYDWHYSFDIVIPSQIDGKDVTIIGDDSFSAKGLTSVVIPDTVKEIETFAFAYNNLLTSIDIPSSVVTIEAWSFYTTGLTSVTFHEGLRDIAYAAFQDSYITSVVLPNTVRNLDYYCFANNEITNLVLPEGLETIEGEAFQMNRITSLTLPEGLKTIGVLAFQGNNISSLTIPDSLREIGAAAFAINNITSLTIPEGVETIRAYAFSGNGVPTLTEATILSKSPTIFTNIDDIFAMGVTTSDFKLTGYAGSPAEAYALDKGFDFVEIKDITPSMIDAIPLQEYTGSAITPPLHINDGTSDLVLGTDYTVSYEDNTAGGSATALITGLGKYRYSSPLRKTFTIERKNYQSSNPTANSNPNTKDNLLLYLGLSILSGSILTGIIIKKYKVQRKVN